jgi:hypothetical protein
MTYRNVICALSVLTLSAWAYSNEPVKTRSDQGVVVRTSMNTLHPP